MRNGIDPKLTLSQPTFYRHRSAILKQTGIDISQPYRPENIDDDNRNRDLFNPDIFSTDYLKSHVDNQIHPLIFK